MTDYRCSHHNLCSEQRRKKVPCFVKELSEIIRDSIVLSAPVKLRAIGVFKPCERKDKQKIYPCKHTQMYYIFLTELHSQPLPAQLQFVFSFQGVHCSVYTASNPHNKPYATACLQFSFERYTYPQAFS